MRIAIVFALLLSLQARPQRRPNIALTMADDIGLGDIGLQHRERTGKEPLAPPPRLIYRQGKWKLIIQSNHRLTEWEPIALFDREANPKETEKNNLLNHPEYESRVSKMLKRYRELRDSKKRTR